MLLGPVRALLVLTSAAVLALSGCGQPADRSGAGDGLWSQLPDSPIPFQRRALVSFWTGDQLVVAGGRENGPTLEGSAEARQLEFSGQTVSYNPVSGLWSELDPLIVEGYDGIQYGYGAWTGSEWLGYGLPCRNGIGTDVDETGLCSDSHVILRWTPEGGWSVVQELLEEVDVLGGDQPMPRLVGAYRGQVLYDVYAPVQGYLLLDPVAGKSTFQPWPALTGGTIIGMGCLVGDEYLTLGSVEPVGPLGPTVGAFFAALDLAAGTARVIASPPSPVNLVASSPTCTGDGLLYQVLHQADIFRLGADGSIAAVPAPSYALDVGAPQGVVQFPLELFAAQVTAERGVFAFGGRPWLFEPDIVEFTKLSPTLSLSDTVAGSGLIFARAAPSYDQAPGRWFQLDTDASSADLAAAAFPITPDMDLGR